MELLIRGGRIIDGSGNPWYRADLAVRNGRIAAVGKLEMAAERVIDAEGLVVAPGFIDTHSHSDLMLLVEPDAEMKIMQGITTEIVGQDGLGEAPIRDDLIGDWRRYLSGLNGDPEIEWDWRSFSEYLRRLEGARPAANVASLVGHGNLRLLSMGMENRRPTREELDEMRGLLEEALEEGALGLSTGLIYPPCSYSDLEELTSLCHIVKAQGGIFVSHIRNEGDWLLEALDEVITIGRRTGVPVHVSHLKASGERNWGRMVEALERIESARAEGIDITFDQYPYTAGSTYLSSLLPGWAHEGGPSKMLERIRDEDSRRRIIEEMRSPRGENWDGILISHVKTGKNRPLVGRRIGEAASEMGLSPQELVLKLVEEEENAASMILFSMSELDVETAMRSRLGMICTDGLMLGTPHPRAYGSFPRVLGRYARHRGLLSLEEAVRKMTSLPAQRFGLMDRGLLRPGLAADITIFDPESVMDKATFEDPRRFPEGIEYVVVNGAIAVEDGVYKGVRAGRVLRRV
jgi:N-acyl-D-amino-acid deacylase